MKKQVGLRIIAVLLLICLCGMQVNAAQVPSVAANLTAKQKTNSSNLKMLDAAKVYCETTQASKYSIQYEAIGSNNGKTGVSFLTLTYGVGKKGTVKTKRHYNYYKIRLTGKKNNGKKTNSCIGYGKISE